MGYESLDEARKQKLHQIFEQTGLLPIFINFNIPTDFHWTGRSPKFPVQIHYFLSYTGLANISMSRRRINKQRYN